MGLLSPAPVLPGNVVPSGLLLATCTVPGLLHLLPDVRGGTTVSVHPIARPTCFTCVVLGHAHSLIKLLQAGRDRARPSRRCTGQLGGGPCSLLSEEPGTGVWPAGHGQGTPSALLPTGPSANFQEKHSTRGSRSQRLPPAQSTQPSHPSPGRAQPGRVATPPTPLLGDGSERRGGTCAQCLRWGRGLRVQTSQRLTSRGAGTQEVRSALLRALRREAQCWSRRRTGPSATSPFQASLHLLEAVVFPVLKAVCCDDLTLNRWRKGIIESQTFTSS